MILQDDAKLIYSSPQSVSATLVSQRRVVSLHSRIATVN
jgi:hypothetical protein